MIKSKSQYKRKPHLIRAAKKISELGKETETRRLAWEKLLSSNFSEDVIKNLAKTLAALELEPDENGLPIGKNIPELKQDPLSLLDGLVCIILDSTLSNEYTITVPEYSYTLVGFGRTHKILDTITWKADILEAATLIWAGIIDVAEIPDIYLYDSDETNLFLTTVLCVVGSCDLERFWKRPGMGKSASDVKEMWERCERIVEPERLSDWLRKSRGGTSSK